MNWADVLPRVNACLNATSVCLLLAGFWAIKRRYKNLHRALMLAALVDSALFLVCYLWRVFLTGTHRFPDVGLVRSIYWVLLTSHMILAVVILPMIARTLYLAATEQWAKHRALARFTWPLWLYVGITGVVVYWMLYHLAPALAAALTP